MLYRLLRPILFMLPPEVAHSVALKSLSLLTRLGLGRLFKQRFPKAPINLMGLHFPNRFGVAAGLDKNGDYIDALAAMGFGFVEIGTITPKPQIGNPKPRLFRLVSSKALINRMGFNNKGVDYLIKNVKNRKSKVILGINIGKNATTPMDNAIDDYVTCFQKVYPYADYITANISSPNTKNLRELQSGDALVNLVKTLKAEQHKQQQLTNRYVPLAIKVAPDLTDEQILYLSNVFIEHKVDAVIATNTTIKRVGCEQTPLSQESGGLSGKPLFELSNQTLAQFKTHLNNQIPLIGVGGITTSKDAQTKLNQGASLVQLYTGLVYGVKKT